MRKRSIPNRRHALALAAQGNKASVELLGQVDYLLGGLARPDVGLRDAATGLADAPGPLVQHLLTFLLGLAPQPFRRLREVRLVVGVDVSGTGKDGNDVQLRARAPGEVGGGGSGQVGVPGSVGGK